MIDVILTQYKRNNLEKQIDAILAQEPSNLISNIFVWQNESHVDISDILSKYPQVQHIHCKQTNFKYHGRFTVPLLSSNDFYAIFDDDTIPNKRWLEHAVYYAKKGCIVGGNGRFYSGKPGVGLCDGTYNSDPIECDVVGHCWVFERKAMEYMWKHLPQTYENGEDIQLCCGGKLYGDYKIIIPPQPRNNPDVWCDTQPQLGSDEHASWKRENHNEQRKKLFDSWIRKGWKPL